MKKIFTYIIIAAAMTFAASCAEEHIGGVDNSDATVTLRLQTSEMDTRATVTETGNVIAGVGAENTLTHADFFFFSDSEGENLINHVRLISMSISSMFLTQKILFRMHLMSMSWQIILQKLLRLPAKRHLLIFWIMISISILAEQSQPL